MLKLPKIDIDLSAMRGNVLLLPNHTAALIFNLAVPEQSLIDWCVEIMPTGTTFIDIGAHVGTYSLAMARNGFNVVAFECQKRTYSCLMANIALNNYEDMITAYNVALTSPELATNVTTTLRIISEDGGGSSIMQLPINGAPIRVESVQLSTVDKMINSTNKVGMIKIDVEGAELDVLRGATSTITRDQPYIIFEAWSDKWYADARTKLFKYISKLEYEIHTITGYPHMFLATPKNVTN